MDPQQQLSAVGDTSGEKRQRIMRPNVGPPLLIPPEPRRIRTRDYTPSSIKPWAVNVLDFSPERDHLQVLQSAITLAFGEAMHNEALITNDAGYTPFPLFQRATFVNDTTVEDLLPQYVSGANVGIDETNFVVIGPYNALYAKHDTDPIANNKFSDQLYVLNVDPANNYTIICQIRIRFFLDQGGKGA